MNNEKQAKIFQSQYNHLEKQAHYLYNKIDEYDRIIKFQANEFTDDEYKAFEENYDKVLNQIEEIETGMENLYKMIRELD